MITFGNLFSLEETLYSLSFNYSFQGVIELQNPF